VTIEEAALAAASLVALTGGAYEEARGDLRAMAETASTGDELTSHQHFASRQHRLPN